METNKRNEINNIIKENVEDPNRELYILSYENLIKNCINRLATKQLLSLLIMEENELILNEPRTNLNYIEYEKLLKLFEKENIEIEDIFNIELNYNNYDIIKKIENILIK